MPQKIIDKNKIKSALVTTVGHMLPPSKSPDESLGDLFEDVQLKRIYNDSKTFIDLVPKSNPRKLQRDYNTAKKLSGFDIKRFVEDNFYEINTNSCNHDDKKSFNNINEYIDNFWQSSTREMLLDKGSLIGLPQPYIVPGGRFNEQFYWDSYFIMLGLAAGGKWDMVEDMIKNFAFMIRKFGFIPTANRTYFISRSQPPFFSQMVRLLAGHKGRKVLVKYLPSLLQEHRFWMKYADKLKTKENSAISRVVQIDRGALLNRYYDNKNTPRPESARQDVRAAKAMIEPDAKRLYLQLRAAAESGWDFCSRWMTGRNLNTVITTDIVPIDLNCLVYMLEMTIADTYEFTKQFKLSEDYKKLATHRAAAISRYCWDESTGFFYDYNFYKYKITGKLTIAGVFPLYAKIATKQQAARVVKTIEKEFLKKGGVISTATEGSQQWDSPNGWAPTQYITIQALRNYGYDKLADKIKQRWIKTNLDTFKKTQQLYEKYNVVDPDKLPRDGEYSLQLGFGWTAGVLAALLGEDK